MTTIKPAPLFEDAHVAGGWTDSPAVARRICTAIWKATNAFGRITNYQADVVLDYETILRNIEKLEPGAQFEFTYSVGDNGTHLATLLSTQADGIGERAYYDSHVEGVLNYDSGPNTAKFIGWVKRSEYQTDEYGQRYGADKYGLVIHTVELVK